MAIVIIEPGHALVRLGGLVTSTRLNLFLLPALHLRFGTCTSLAVGIGDDLKTAAGE